MGDTMFFPQVAEYEELVQEHVDRMKLACNKRAGKGAPEEERALITMKERLAKERNTWRLIGKLFAVKTVMGHKEGEDSASEDKMDDGESQSANASASASAAPPQEQTLINALMNHDENLRRAQTVVDWLEQNARDDLPEVVNAYGVSMSNSRVFYGN